jgi:hypothetical protein
MSYQITDVKNDVSRKLHGTTLDRLSGSFYDIAYEAARETLSRIDPQETKRKSALTNAVYNSVYSYPLPADIKGDKFISILPQVGARSRNNLRQVYGEHFELYKDDIKGIADVEYSNGNKILKLAINGGKAGKTLHTGDSIASNGTWAASGDASGLTEDKLNKYAGSKSLRFNLDASGSAGVLTNSTFTAVDCSDEEDTGAVFMPVFLSTAANVTSVQLKWGSDASNYWSVTTTTTNEGLSFQDGWNLLRFDWEDATETGSPVASAVDYLEATLNYNGTATPNCRIDNIVVRLGEIYDIHYYSKNIFKNAAGTWIEKPTADTDTINLDTDSYNIFLYQLMVIVVQELQGEDGVFDRNYFMDKLDMAVENYTSDNRGEAIKSQSNYREPLTRRRSRGGSTRR